VVAAVTQGEGAFADALVQVSQKRAAAQAAQEALNQAEGGRQYLESARRRANEALRNYPVNQFEETVLRRTSQHPTLESALRGLELDARQLRRRQEALRDRVRDLAREAARVGQGQLRPGEIAGVYRRFNLDAPYLDVVQQVDDAFPVQNPPVGMGPHEWSAQRDALERQLAQADLLEHAHHISENTAP